MFVQISLLKFNGKKREIFVNTCGIKFCLSTRYVHNYTDMYYRQVHWGGSILIKNDLNYEFFFPQSYLMTCELIWILTSYYESQNERALYHQIGLLKIIQKCRTAFPGEHYDHQTFHQRILHCSNLIAKAEHCFFFGCCHLQIVSRLLWNCSYIKHYF